MKIVLLENVDHLGIIGDVKDVSEGYARNYLLPKKLVAKLGDNNAKILLKDIVGKREKTKGEAKKIEKLAAQLNGKELEFEMKVTPQKKLFGSVGAKDVIEKLKLDKKDIQMAPIKTIGAHNVKIYLGHNISTNLVINIKPIASKSNKE